MDIETGEDDSLEPSVGGEEENLLDQVENVDSEKTIEELSEDKKQVVELDNEEKLGEKEEEEEEVEDVPEVKEEFFFPPSEEEVEEIMELAREIVEEDPRIGGEEQEEEDEVKDDEGEVVVTAEVEDKFPEERLTLKEGSENEFIEELEIEAEEGSEDKSEESTEEYRKTSKRPEGSKGVHFHESVSHEPLRNNITSTARETQTAQLSATVKGILKTFLRFKGPLNVKYASHDTKLSYSEILQWQRASSVRRSASTSVSASFSKTQVSPAASESEGIEKLDIRERRPAKFIIEEDVEGELEIDLPIMADCQEAKDVIAFRLGAFPEDFWLEKDGVQVFHDDLVFKDCAKGEMPIMKVVFGLDLYTSSSASSSSFEPDYKVIKVKLENEDGTHKYLEVSIKNVAFTKEFCGGFRNKKTKVVYYNAWTQTQMSRRKENKAPGRRDPQLYSRSIQTHLPYVDTGTSTMVERSTQMWRPDVYIPATTDIIVEVKPYVSLSEQKKNMIPEEAVLIIQRAWRRHARRIKKEKEKMEKDKEENMVRKSKKKKKFKPEEALTKERLVRLVKDSYPMTRNDFYNLYIALANYKQTAIAAGRAIKSGPAFKTWLCKVSEMEAQCLSQIEAQRIKSKEESLRRQDYKFLEVTSQPRVKRYPKGNITIVDDLNIQRARVFKEIFASYRREDLSRPERLDVLANFREMFAQMNAVDMTQDLITMLDREALLINIGIEDSRLEVLRRRFESQFFNLVRNPEFNPQAKFFKKDIEPVEKQPLYRCVGCLKVMRPCYFYVHTRLISYKFCMSCAWMQRIAVATVDYALYARMLEGLRESERQKCCRSAVVFLLQPVGMHMLVDIIWNGRSAVSYVKHLPSLRMTRWWRDEEWSPWNTILLTQKEANIHDQIPDSEKENYYTKEFILDVKKRLVLARMHFNRVYAKDIALRDTGQWVFSNNDEGIYTRKEHSKNLAKDRPLTFFKRRPEFNAGLETCFCNAGTGKNSGAFQTDKYQYVRKKSTGV